IGRSATSWRVVLPAPSPREIHARNFRIGDAAPDWPKSAPPGTAIVAPPAAAAATLCFNNFPRDNAEFFVPTSYSLRGSNLPPHYGRSQGATGCALSSINLNLNRPICAARVRLRHRSLHFFSLRKRTVEEETHETAEYNDGFRSAGRCCNHQLGVRPGKRPVESSE